MSQKLEQAQKDEFSIKAWLLRKALQYLDNMISNAITGITFAGVLWLVQQFWGLRFIPFSILDAILLALASIIVFLLLIAGFLYLYLRHFIGKYPNVVLGLMFGGIIAAMVANYMSKVDIASVFAKAAQSASGGKSEEETTNAPKAEQTQSSHTHE